MFAQLMSPIHPIAALAALLSSCQGALDSLARYIESPTTLALNYVEHCLRILLHGSGLDARRKISANAFVIYISDAL
jgi:hypothetical protein